jgi:hypothetical protein
MPLENPNAIDIVASEDGTPLLVITDSGATSNPEQRHALFLAKLAAYAAALRDKKFQQKVPDYRRAKIQLVAAKPPSEAMRQVSAITVQPDGEEPFEVPVNFKVLPLPY